MRAANRRSCSSFPDLQPDLDQRDAAIDDVFLDLRAELQETLMLLLGAKSHDVFDAGAVVPAAIEDDDLAGRRKLLDIALHEHLRLFDDPRAPEAPPPETPAGSPVR